MLHSFTVIVLLLEIRLTILLLNEAGKLDMFNGRYLFITFFMGFCK